MWKSVKIWLAREIWHRWNVVTFLRAGIGELIGTRVQLGDREAEGLNLISWSPIGPSTGILRRAPQVNKQMFGVWEKRYFPAKPPGLILWFDPGNEFKSGLIYRDFRGGNLVNCLEKEFARFNSRRFWFFLRVWKSNCSLSVLDNNLNIIVRI